ncbi:MAG TPA: hypothetical protein VK489_08425 [Ferruginibacter sp.]|nr:hypothetical protein [Ferruginibacter sp.]
MSLGSCAQQINTTSSSTTEPPIAFPGAINGKPAEVTATDK